MGNLYGKATHIRPAFFAAVGYLLGILTAEATGAEALLGWLLCACAALVGIIFYPNRRVLGIAALCCVFFAGMGMYAATAQTDVSAFTGKTATVTGRVEEVRTGEYAYTYTLGDAEMVNQDGSREKIPGRLFVRAYNEGQEYGQKAEEGKADFAVFDRLQITGEMEEPTGPRVPNGFDDKRYCLSRGVYLRMDAEEITKTGSCATALEAAMQSVKTTLSNTADRLFGEEAAVAKALFLGDQSEIDEETTQGYRATGAAHVLAVSGLHVGFIAGILFFLLRWIPLNRWIRFAILTAALVFYAALTGMRVSVIRAGFMFVVLLLGRTLRRPTDTLTFLSLAFLATLFFNPAQVFDLGFELSYAAVFSILCLSKPLATLLHIKKNEIGLSACASAAGTAGTAPIIANAFGTFSTYSVLFNVIIIPMAMVATVCAALGIALGSAADWLGMPFAWVGKGAIALMNLITQAGARIPGAVPDVAAVSALGMAVIYGGIFLFSGYVRIRIRKKIAAFAGASAILAAVILAGNWLKPPLSIAFLDVGNANAAVISTKEGKNYVIDAGNSEDGLAEYLVKNGIFADATILTHADEDHIGGAPAAAEKGRTGQLYISAAEQARLAEKYPDLLAKPLCKGDRIAIGEDAELLVLAPENGEISDESNENSLILLLRYAGRDIAAFMGDAPVEAALRAFPERTEIPILVVGHHGSDTSTSSELVERLCPQNAVISAKKELGDETEQALSGISQWKTGELGSIFVSVDDEITIRSMYAGK